MQPLDFIHAPTNLGLGRHSDGRERQPAKLPQALVQGGLIESILTRAFTHRGEPLLP